MQEKKITSYFSFDRESEQVLTKTKTEGLISNHNNTNHNITNTRHTNPVIKKSNPREKRD